MVVDGNKKIRRSVCSASHAGFLEYPRLSGPINIGCVNSPAYKSRFCEKHTSRSCNKMASSVSENEVHNQETQQKPTGEDVVQLLLEKKTTRGVIYYKVSDILNGDDIKMSKASPQNYDTLTYICMNK